MFSLAPFNISPSLPPGNFRTGTYVDHEQIESLINDSVDQVVNEWCTNKIPLGSSSKCAYNLFLSLDHFLSNGCLEGNRTYWGFVVEFLPKSLREYFQRECKARSDRDLCVIWLKDSLNRQELSYYFQSFLLNWTLVRKNYATTAMIRKRSTTQRIVSKIFETIEVQFCFRVRQEIKEDVPVAAVRTLHNGATLPSSSTSSQRGLRRKKRHGDSEDSEDAAFSAISDIQIAPDLVENQPDSNAAPYLSTTKDFDYVFAEIIEKGEKQLPSTTSLPEKLNSYERQRDLLGRPASQCNLILPLEPNTTTESGKITDNNKKQVSNPFDVAVKSSLSQVQLINAPEVNARSKEILSSAPVFFDPAPFGELCLDVGEVIGLSINVFKTEAEKFLRFFQVYEKFGTGHPQQRFLVLSSQSVYLLSLDCKSSAQKFYVIHSYLPLKRIEFIYVSPDYQTLFIHSEKGFNNAQRDVGAQVVEVCTACTKLGETIVHAISFAYSNANENQELDVFTEETAHHFILKRFLTKELFEQNVLIACYTLALWWQTDVDFRDGSGLEYSGYLYYKMSRNGSWLTGSEEFQQSFFYLKNQKFYQFTDSSCKIGERIISLQDSTSVATKIIGDESQNMFELEFQNGDKLQFHCQSRGEMESWTSLLNIALSTTDREDNPVACVVAITNRHIMIAQEGENCLVDGFMRSLSVIPFSQICWVAGVIGQERYACVMSDGRKCDWLFLRSPDELDRVLFLFEQREGVCIRREDSASSRFVTLVNSLPNSGDVFYFEPFETHPV